MEHRVDGKTAENEHGDEGDYPRPPRELLSSALGQEETLGLQFNRSTLAAMSGMNDNGAEVITYPDGGTTPFQGGKLTTWEGGMRAPLVVRWPGHIKPGTIKNDIFSSLDWLPTFVEIAGGAKGNELKKQIEKGAYPGIVKTTLDGVNQSRLSHWQIRQVGP